jgi:hypothetical protein
VTPKKKTQEPAKAPRSTARRVKTLAMPTEIDVASRAYQLFVQRGGEHGRDWEDWLIAERELLSPDR